MSQRNETPLMSLNRDAIDRIVANVLREISPSEPDAPQALAPPREPEIVNVPERVVTAEVLESLGPGRAVSIRSTAIVTPAARDVIRERGLNLVRASTEAGSQNTEEHQTHKTVPVHVYIVRHTEPLDRVLSDQLPGSRRELLGCPDEAAQAAIGEICRGATSLAIIAAEQTHRAACLANRHERVKAVAVRDAGEVKAVRGQLRANVWCFDPGGRTYYELRNLIREIRASAGT